MRMKNGFFMNSRFRFRTGFICQFMMGMVVSAAVTGIPIIESLEAPLNAGPRTGKANPKNEKQKPIQKPVKTAGQTSKAPVKKEEKSASATTSKNPPAGKNPAPNPAAKNPAPKPGGPKAAPPSAAKSKPVAAKGKKK